MSLIRIASLNVHFFTDLKEQSNVHRLAQFLKPMTLDVLALQEILHTTRSPDVAPETHYHFKLLSDLLELPYMEFCETSFEFGNGILSRFPILSSVNHYTEAIEDRNIRGMLAVQIDHQFFKDNNATFYVTHLDQMREHVRLQQIEHFEKYITNKDAFQLIMGDFNSLTFDDYSDDYFNVHIHDVRERNKWEGPFNLVTNKMKENGYSDCWREMDKEAINDQAVTCVYKTRIDYIWRRGELKNGWKIDDCRSFSTDDATDHNGIFITFTQST